MNWNEYFDPVAYMTEAEYQVYLAEGMLYATECWLHGYEADKLYPDQVGLPTGLYHGSIVARSAKQAVRIANKRGWGENIRGKITATSPLTDFKLSYN